MTSKQHTDSLESMDLLKAFNCMYGRRQSPEALMQEATRVLVELLHVRCCMITCQKEEKGTMQVTAASHQGAYDDLSRTVVTNGDRGVQVQEVWQSLQAGRPLQKGRNVKKLIAPIRVNGEIVGNICIPDETPSNGNPHPVNTELYSTICAHVGFALELQQMRQMWATQYSIEQRKLEHQILAATRKPEHAAKIMARSFYKQLRKAGFETKQILIVASEIIDNLNKTLSKTRQKSKTKEQEVSDKH